MAENDDRLFVVQCVVEFVHEPFKLAGADGSAVEGGFDDVAIIRKQMAVGFGLRFVDGGDLHAVEHDEASAVRAEGVVEAVEAHDRFVAFGRHGEAVVARDVVHRAGEAGEHVAHGDEVGLGFGAFAADEVAELDNKLHALARPLFNAAFETGFRLVAGLGFGVVVNVGDDAEPERVVFRLAHGILVYASPNSERYFWM